jgi:GR25 family glycosyltransferase involved in LPS biosynthesis
MKVDRALIIRGKDVPLSVEYAQICAESCEQFGVPYEFIDAVYESSGQVAYDSVGAKIKKNWGFNNGNAGCHASMIKCWDRIIEIDKPCIILEHDAILVGDVRTVDIPDDASVTFGFRVSNRDDYQPIAPADKLTKVRRSVGCHAYAITPKTAKWLIHNARVDGLTCGVDRWLMMGPVSGLPVYVADPPQAVCWIRKSTMGHKSNKNNRRQGVWAPHNDSQCKNLPSWQKGMQNESRTISR